VLVGVDVGQIHDPSALVVCRSEPRLLTPGDPLAGEYPTFETHFVCLGCERLPLGTSYPAVAARVAQIAERLIKREDELPVIVLVDATDVGRPVVDLLRERINPKARVVAVTLTGGDKGDDSALWRQEAKVSKVHLVSRLQALLQSGRLHLPRSAALEALLLELKVFEIRTRPHSATPETGSFSLEANDDLAIALGLACLAEHAEPRYDAYSFSSLPSAL
jgi:hypothetical protein